ncbi:MAG: hypothetical protein AAFO69_02985 [Bacteroidota bacterium]
MVDKQEINGILNSIKDKVPTLDWDFVSKYHNGEHSSIMELRLFRVSSTKYFGRFIFNGSSGRLLEGRYGKTLQFNNGPDLLDALLEVLFFEIKRKSRATLSTAVSTV